MLGGIPIVEGGPDGGQITGPGQIQFGDMLLGGGTSAGWRKLTGWRDLPEGAAADSLKPQAHGAYPGDVFGSSIVVTFDYLLRGSPADKVAHLDTIEKHAPMDGVERCLAVDDGTGVWFRMARVLGRTVPQDIHFTHAPLECSIQFLCADPRRYSLTLDTGLAELPESSGGLEYPLVYSLEYGTSSTGSILLTNDGSTATPLVAVFNGPLEKPVMSTPDWSAAFDITLAGGEFLTVDTAAGTAQLNGNADRLYTLQPYSDPLELCVLQPGPTEVSLTAESGTGTITISFRDARM